MANSNAKQAAIDAATNQTGSTNHQWSGQQPGRSTDTFLSALLDAILTSIIETGSFNMKQLDHRAHNYLHVSNKELAIHAAQLAGRPMRDYRLSKLVVLDALAAGARFVGPASASPELLAALNPPDSESQAAGADTGSAEKEGAQ